MPRTKEEYNEYMREYMIKRYHARKSEMIEMLGGVCAKCSACDRLEIDHIDRAKKTMTVERMCFVSWHKAHEELKNCQLLCRKCHEQKSINDLGHKPREHGDITMYRHGKCRCSLCRKAWTEHNKKYKKKKV